MDAEADPHPQVWQSKVPGAGVMAWLLELLLRAPSSHMMGSGVESPLHLQSSFLLMCMETAGDGSDAWDLGTLMYLEELGGFSGH